MRARFDKQRFLSGVNERVGLIARRHRGIAGTAVVFGAGFAVTELAYSFSWLVARTGIPLTTRVGWTMLGGCMKGAVSGVVFALLLASDGRTHHEEFSLKRLALLGALGSIAIPLLMALELWAIRGGPFMGWGLLDYLWPLALSGAACAMGIFVAARRV